MLESWKALDSAMAIWAGHDLARYSFAYPQQHCFCNKAYRQPLMVQVQDATVISVANRFGDSVLDAVADFVSSIESIFFTVQEAINNITTDEINVAYNEEYGYPTSLYIDYDY
jgi:hypothetical protein